jgi:hypothetical protein
MKMDTCRRVRVDDSTVVRVETALLFGRRWRAQLLIDLWMWRGPGFNWALDSWALNFNLGFDGCPYHFGNGLGPELGGQINGSKAQLTKSNLIF